MKRMNQSNIFLLVEKDVVFLQNEKSSLPFAALLFFRGPVQKSFLIGISNVGRPELRELPLGKLLFRVQSSNRKNKS